MEKERSNEPSMEYKIIIDTKFEETFGKFKCININWLYDIILICERNNIDNRIITDLITQLTTPENLIKMRKTKNFLIDSIHVEQEKSFFKYIEGLDKENKQQYIQQGVLFALDNLTEDKNIVDNFIKYIVLTNYSDIEYVSTIPNLNHNNTAYVNCYLGGLELCHNTNITISEHGNNDIECEWFHTRRGLQGLKLGAQIMRKLMQDVQKHFPDKNIISFNVLKNNLGAIRFYCNNGGELFDITTGEKIDKESLQPDAKGSLGVVFDRSKFQEIIDREIVIPEINSKYLSSNEETCEVQ